MPTIHEALRGHLYTSLLKQAGCGDDMPPLELLKETEWSAQFERLMRNRLIMGAFRYGRMRDEGKGEYDHAEGIRRHLKEYEETGNTENLVDIANLALVEFEVGVHPLKHWRAKDDSEHCEQKK